MLLKCKLKKPTQIYLLIVSSKNLHQGAWADQISEVARSEGEAFTLQMKQLHHNFKMSTAITYYSKGKAFISHKCCLSCS